jgi:hypothetical protein
LSLFGKARVDEIEVKIRNRKLFRLASVGGHQLAIEVVEVCEGS